MWLHELTLIKESYGFDSVGNQTIKEIKTEVFCSCKSITRSEFYNAATTGFKPSIVFVINSFEYNNEEKVEFEEGVYKVIRTYLNSTDRIELICEKVLGIG